MTHKPFADRLAAGAAGLTALACLTGALAAAPAHAAEISTREVADGLFLFQGAGSNVVAMEDGGQLLVIDGGLDENSGDLLAAIEAATGTAAIGTLIDTHWHPEQVGLNDEAGAQGATIIAHDQTHMYLSNRVTSPIYEEAFGPLPEASLPTQYNRYGGELTFAGHTAQYGYLPAAHTNGDLYVFFPDLNVLVAGGAVGSDSWPLLDYWNGAIIGGLVQAHEKLAEIVSDDTVVIPAHGPAITGADLKRHRDMYRQLFRDVSHMMNNGMGYDDAPVINPLRGHEDEFGDPSEFLNGAYRSKEMAEVPS